MLFDFFFEVESGHCVLWIIDMLSPYVNVGPMIGIPIIQSLYRNPHDASMPCFITTNSAQTLHSQLSLGILCATSHMPYNEYAKSSP